MTAFTAISTALSHTLAPISSGVQRNVPADSTLSLCCLFANRWQTNSDWLRVCSQFSAPADRQLTVYSSYEDAETGMRMVTFVSPTATRDSGEDQEEHVVFAFRGTLLNRRGNLAANLQIALDDGGEMQIVGAAVAAIEHTLAELKAVHPPGTRFAVATTGHSLGGFVAKACAVVRLALIGRCVAFEAPGLTTHYHRLASQNAATWAAFSIDSSSSMVSRTSSSISDKGNGGGSSSGIVDLLWRQRITSYVAAPNPVNTCLRHLGTVVRVHNTSSSSSSGSSSSSDGTIAMADSISESAELQMGFNLGPSAASGGARSGGDRLAAAPAATAAPLMAVGAAAPAIVSAADAAGSASADKNLGPLHNARRVLGASARVANATVALTALLCSVAAAAAAAAGNGSSGSGSDVLLGGAGWAAGVVDAAPPPPDNGGDDNAHPVPTAAVTPALLETVAAAALSAPGGDFGMYASAAMSMSTLWWWWWWLLGASGAFYALATLALGLVDVVEDHLMWGMAWAFDQRTGKPYSSTVVDSLPQPMHRKWQLARRALQQLPTASPAAAVPPLVPPSSSNNIVSFPRRQVEAVAVVPKHPQQQQQQQQVSSSNRQGWRARIAITVVRGAICYRRCRRRRTAGCGRAGTAASAAPRM